MRTAQKLANYDHPLVQETAQRLTENETTVRGKLEKLFYYTRDDIKFGFLPEGDLAKASDLVRYEMGQCNNKAALFLALAKAIGIPARIHFSLIDKEIQRGLFSGFAYRFIPKRLSHAWVEVEVDGKWRPVDAYINDQSFYLAGRAALKRRGWTTGYSISCATGESSMDFDLDEEKFVQMGAVSGDHGVWDDPGEYYATDLYGNRLNALKTLYYRWLIRRINRRVARMRAGTWQG